VPRVRAASLLAVIAALSLTLPVTGRAAEAATATAGPRTTSVSQGLGTGQAVTADPGALTLTRVSPVLATRGQPVTLGGRLDLGAVDLEPQVGVTPTPTVPPTDPATDPPASGPEPIARVEVRLAAPGPTDREGVTRWLTGTGAAPGRVVGSTAIPPQATASGSAEDTEPVSFSVALGDLSDSMTDAYGILPVSVEVWAPGAVEPASVIRTFLPYQQRKEYAPLQLTLVVPFTVPRDLALVGEIGEERTAAWEALVGEEGALRMRLEDALDERVTWAVDPALLGAGPALVEEDDSLSPEGETPSPTGSPGPTGTDPSRTDPSRTTAPGTTAPATGTATSPPATGDGTTDNGTRDGGTTDGGEPTDTPTGTDAPVPEEPPAVNERRVRSEFAAELLDAVRGREILLLPRHDADVVVLPAAGAAGRGPDALRSLIDDSLDVDADATVLTAAGAQVVPTLWPADGAWSASLDASADALPATARRSWSVLASSASLAGPVRGPFPSEAGRPVLPYDEGLSERAAGAVSEDASLVTALAVAADTLVTLDEQPGTARHLIAVLDRDATAPQTATALAGTLDEVPWVELDGLADAGHRGALVPESAAAAAPPPVLDEDRARDLAGTLDRLPVAASVRADTGAELASRGADTLAQLTSLRWRGDEEDWTTAYSPLGEDVAETFTGLSIPSRDISFLADTGLLRIAVENTLDTGIENATLDLVVAHPILRIESEPQPVEVGPGSRSTVAFEATAIASGRVTVTATLRAPDGTVLGEPTTFSVRVSPTSDWIYWLLGGLAAAVIVVGVVRTVLRRHPST
jgi:hypothetical protein